MGVDRHGHLKGWEDNLLYLWYRFKIMALSTITLARDSKAREVWWNGGKIAAVSLGPEGDDTEMPLPQVVALLDALGLPKCALDMSMVEDTEQTKE